MLVAPEGIYIYSYPIFNYIETQFCISRVTSLADRLKIDFALIHTDRARANHHFNSSYNAGDDSNGNGINGNGKNITTAIINGRPVVDEDEDEEELHSPPLSAATSVTGEMLPVED